MHWLIGIFGEPSAADSPQMNEVASSSRSPAARSETAAGSRVSRRALLCVLGGLTIFSQGNSQAWPYRFAEAPKAYSFELDAQTLAGGGLRRFGAFGRGGTAMTLDYRGDSSAPSSTTVFHPFDQGTVARVVQLADGGSVAIGSHLGTTGSWLFVARLDAGGGLIWTSDVLESDLANVPRCVVDGRVGDSGDIYVAHVCGLLPAEISPRAALRIDLASGSLLETWQLPATTEEVRSLRLLAGDAVLLGTYSSTTGQSVASVYEFRTGNTRWARPVREVHSRSDGADLIVARSQSPLDGGWRLARLDPASGAALWDVSIGAPLDVSDLVDLGDGATGLVAKFSDAFTDFHFIDLTTGTLVTAGRVQGKYLSAIAHGSGRIAVAALLESPPNTYAITLSEVQSGTNQWSVPVSTPSPYVAGAMVRRFSESRVAVLFSEPRCYSCNMRLQVFDVADGNAHVELDGPMESTSLTNVVGLDGGRIAVAGVLATRGSDAVRVDALDLHTGSVAWTRRFDLSDGNFGALDYPMLVRAQGSRLVLSARVGILRDGVYPNGSGEVLATLGTSDGGVIWAKSGVTGPRFGTPLQITERVAVAPDGSVYVSGSEVVVSPINPYPQSRQARLAKQSADSGEVDWYQTSAGSRSAMLGVSNGVIDRAGDGAVSLLSESTGSTTWANSPDPGVGGLAIAGPGDDFIIDGRSYVAGKVVATFRRVDSLTGASRWMVTLPTSDLGNALSYSMRVVAPDSLVVAGTSRCGATTCAVFARIDLDSGLLRWINKFGRDDRNGTQLSQVREDGEGSYLSRLLIVPRGAKTAGFALRGYQAFLARFDSGTGELEYVQHLGTGSGGSGFSSAREVQLVELTPNGLEMVHAGQVWDEGQQSALTLATVPHPPPAFGNLTLRPTYTAGNSGSIDAVDYVVRVRFEGTTAASGIEVVSANSGGVVVTNPTCEIVGSGSCSAARVLTQVRHRLDLSPGSEAILRGRFHSPAVHAARVQYAFVGSLPPQFADRTIADVGELGDLLFANAFED